MTHMFAFTLALPQSLYIIIFTPVDMLQGMTLSISAVNAILLHILQL